jgi:hypothetical protein
MVLATMVKEPHYTKDMRVLGSFMIVQLLSGYNSAAARRLLGFGITEHIVAAKSHS